MTASTDGPAVLAPIAPLPDRQSSALVMELMTGRPGVPFGRLLRTELRKLIDTRAGKWLVIAITVATPITVAVTLFAAKPADLTYSQFVDLAQTPQNILLPILGLLSVTSEWSQRTGLVTFTLEPNRGRVLRAKATAVLLLGLLAIVAAFVAAAVGNALGPAVRHGDGSWHYTAGSFLDMTLAQLTGLALGMAFGMILMISAAALIAYYVVPSLSSLVFSTVPGAKGVKDWLDFNSAQSALYTHITGLGWAQLGVAGLIWIIAPAVAGVLRVSRSEIKSG
jgi:ABC-type transport system involved in multi-copper enzyme maturation permease subunit